ncbi:MAG: phosphate/phosphite/phosphonate ABC transporter substrate-binding protein [Candidatus Cloacimonetes bacterium]|nr:phosphate/phosphite/phosphonate ABC transporter substrate-binding protein [Candidatus Cloacimonadota bacterium]MDY0366539.1 phosphate/phosphite/phosphonate ABC transporter substrate-binding protein [Candidatus Syntrophosphaera sp.]HOY84379.1 phosphate/phosphite/phosphonate ABC transporter substrate-binding protein [Candidatus Syntrophosphaera sp.]HPH60462.1 phosphate/phosphite/phosphonate ABC transporter substrate-binding protein [Candidatus Syntrophosphaera sp.]
MKQAALIVLAFALLLASCMSEANKLEKANLELGSKKNPIKMYFVPSMEASTVVTSGEAIAAWLEQETGYKFKVAVPTSYAAVVEAIGAFQADVAWLPTFAYVLAEEKYGAEVEFMTVRNGLNKYCGQFVARADSGIDSLQHIEGKVVAYTDAASTSGYIYPSAILKQKGIVPARYTLAGGHPQAITAVYNGTADVACTYWSPPDASGKPMDAREKLLQTYPDVFSKLKIVALTDSIPNDTVTFRRGLPAEVQNSLVSALEKFSGSKDGQAVLRELYDIDGLTRATKADYDIVRQTLKTLGKDPGQFFKN